MNYINVDLFHPKYRFHGSEKLLTDYIVPHQAVCELGLEENTKKAIYGTVTLEGAVGFAIPKKTIEGMTGSWTWSMDYDNLKNTLENMTIEEDAYGYVYVFDAKDFVKAGKGIQYVSLEEKLPIDIIKVHYKDYKYLFTFKNDEKVEQKN
jgi:hypothetical protein